MNRKISIFRCIFLHRAAIRHELMLGKGEKGQGMRGGMAGADNENKEGMKERLLESSSANDGHSMTRRGSAGAGGEAGLGALQELAGISLLDFFRATRGTSLGFSDMLTHALSSGNGAKLVDLVRTLRQADASGRQPLSISDVLRKVPRSRYSSRRLACGGIEAVPLVSGDDVSKCLKEAGWSTMPQLLSPTSDMASILSSNTEGDARAPLAHSALAAFISSGGGLWECGLAKKRVAVLLPNGPELATCMLLCMSVCCTVPLNHQQVCFLFEHPYRLPSSSPLSLACTRPSAPSTPSRHHCVTQDCMLTIVGPYTDGCRSDWGPGAHRNRCYHYSKGGG